MSMHQPGPATPIGYAARGSAPRTVPRSCCDTRSADCRLLFRPVYRIQVAGLSAPIGALAYDEDVHKEQQLDRAADADARPDRER